MYDQLIISSIENYSKHPSYLPSIGRHYKEAEKKIFIIGESHYLPKKYNYQIKPEDWYNNPEAIYSKLSKNNIEWIDTRGVIDFFSGPEKLAPGHRIFLNLDNAFGEEKAGAKLFDQAVYFNYFQRPAEEQGGSIQVQPLDSKKALENLIGLNSILNPDLIIFTSSKAFKDFNRTAKKEIKQKLPKIESVPHPACAWWNKTSKKYGKNADGGLSTGKQKFKRIINDMI